MAGDCNLNLGGLGRVVGGHSDAYATAGALGAAAAAPALYITTPASVRA